MVNRGGRSKGCKTCRARKVKCDETQPHCERCLKAGLHCSGYPQFAEFVLVNNSQRVQQRAPHDWTSRPGPKVSDEGIVYITYLMDRLLDTKKPGENAPTKTNTLLPLPDFKQSAPSTMTTQRSAVEALAAAYFGRMHRDQRVMNRGARQYVQTLAMLHSDLSDEKTSLRYETLASVLCLGMYENVILSSNHAWLAHFDGISRLVRMRGPTVLKSEREMHLFRQCRFAVIMSSLIHRRHCFLASSPWTESIKVETAEDHIHAIFGEVPGILHDFSTLFASPSRTELRERVEGLVCSLHRWARCWAPVQELYNVDKVEDGVFLTSSALDASYVVLQKAILLCLGNVCESLQISLRLNETATKIDKQEATPEEERLSLAVQICDLAETCLRESTDSSQKPFLFVFPLQVASRHLQPGSEDAVRAVLLMEYLVADAHGFELGRRQIAAHHLIQD